MQAHPRTLRRIGSHPVTLLVALIAALLFPGKIAAASTSITWNFDTYYEFSNDDIPDGCGTQLYYPRMVKCPNGDMLMFAQSGNSINGGCILYCRSTDGAWSFGPWQVLKRWGPRDWFGQTINAQHANANPLVVDDEILLCYQVRAATALDDTNTGIEVIRSDDDGHTWSAPVVALRARIWEPRMVELADGKLRCYYTRFNDINFVQSPDVGHTWQAPNTSKPNLRMPSPILLKNGSLAIAGESGNNTQGPSVYGPHPVKVANTEFDGYGPQIVQIPHGEVLLCSNGKYRGTQGVWMFIGNSNADNFASAKRPFLDTSGVWPDITLKAPDIVVCSAGNADGIRLIHGRIHF